MSDDNLLPFSFRAVQRETITAAFDGGRITPDAASCCSPRRSVGSAWPSGFAQVIPDQRDQDRVSHLLSDILRARIFAIACGYEDADAIGKV
jgi:hypothetical protein